MKVHLIGIGGIGVSALAQYYLAKGHEVSGSDLVASEITDMLKDPPSPKASAGQRKGAKIFIGHSAKNITRDIDLVVYSPAVKSSNAELKKAKSYKLKAISYPEALGELTKDYYTIAVAGAHGKSTTTAMIGLILAQAGLDPTVIVGTKLKEFGGSNFREGKSKLLVIEACEYDSSFLQYSPKVVVVTNIDKEHLDFFKTFANVKKAFNKFIERLPSEGFYVRNIDDENKPEFVEPKFKIQDYSLKQADARKLENILQVPGKHNVSNALAALQVARILVIPDSVTFSALAKFTGTWRRFEIVKEANKLKANSYTLISDYGHHPNEIRATLEAAREKYAKRKIWCVFQPHQHQRTFYLFDDFVKTFQEAAIDKIIITEIYDVAGRETKGINKKVSSKKLVEKVAKDSVMYLPMDKIESFVKENMEQGSVLIIMGAGDIYNLVEKF